MKISTKVRYATRAMLELSLHIEDKPLFIDAIAKSQDLSKKYLETLLNTLKKSGLVVSVRGKGGGYRLNKKPEDITVKDIYIAMEGKHSLIDCISEKSRGCERSPRCVTIDLWEEVSDAVFGILEKFTLADLRDQTKERMANLTFMYFI
jgi:Rrf2 family protein